MYGDGGRQNDHASSFRHRRFNRVNVGLRRSYRIIKRIIVNVILSDREKKQEKRTKKKMPLLQRSAGFNRVQIHTHACTIDEDEWIIVCIFI